MLIDSKATGADIVALIKHIERLKKDYENTAKQTGERTISVVISDLTKMQNMLCQLTDEPTPAGSACAFAWVVGQELQINPVIERNSKWLRQHSIKTPQQA